MEKKPNVILITIDSLRADHLGFKGYRKDISPNIDKLAQESVNFTNAFANGPFTPNSFPSILTSTYAFDYQGIRKIERPRVLISEVFQKQGYITAAFHSNPYLSDFFGYNRGWDFFEDISLPYEIPKKKKEQEESNLTYKVFKNLFKKITLNNFPEIYFRTVYLKYKLKGQKTEPKVRAEFKNQIIKDFIHSIKKEKSPFFAWIHYMDVHAPYISQETRLQKTPFSFLEIAWDSYCRIASEIYFKERSLSKPLMNFGKKYLKKAIVLYDDEIKYTDEKIGEFLDFLKKENIYQDSLICLTADHGDELLEHSGGSHYQKLYNELLHIPLLIKLSQGKDKMPDKINKKVSLIDLAPTICDLVGIEKAPSFKGKNLFKDSNSLIFHQTSSDIKGGRYNVLGVEKLNHCKMACQSENWKYIIDFGNKIEELYNLSNDPREQNNLFPSEPKILFQMRKAIQKFNKENPPFSLLNNKQTKSY